MTAGAVCSRWLPFGIPAPGPVRLLCLPHAGAGASGYRAWGRRLPRRVAACPVQLPGHETRLREAPHDDVDELVARLADVVLAEDALAEPYALFGHSLGALVAFELARELRRRAAPAPRHLFVSGRTAPQTPITDRPLADLDLDDLVPALRALGGTDEQVLADRALLEHVAPLFRAGFAMNERYRHRAEPPLDVPITVFAATDDPRVTVEQSGAWARQTTARFTPMTLRGGHFAVLDSPVVPAVMGEALSR